MSSERLPAVSMSDGGDLVITKVSARIGTLEKMLDRLEARMADPSTNDRTRAYMREECSAFRAGIAALKLYRADVDGIGDVVGALRRLVIALENGAGVEDAKWDAEQAIKEYDEG